MYVVVEAKRAGQHKFVYCEVLRVRNMRYYFKNKLVQDNDNGHSLFSSHFGRKWLQQG
jgi:hypothetical protein